jgi:hypothetical protein
MATTTSTVVADWIIVDKSVDTGQKFTLGPVNSEPLLQGTLISNIGKCLLYMKKPYFVFFLVERGGYKGGYKEFGTVQIVGEVQSTRYS